MDDRVAGFFKYIFDDDEGYLCIASRHARTGNFQNHFFSYPAALDDAITFIGRQKLTSNVYFCPTLLTDTQRVKENISTTNVLWADLDSCPPDALKVRPQIVLETSQGRYQALWRLAEPMHGLEAEVLNKRIAYFHADEGADKSGWDLTQLLRIPLSINHKYAQDKGLWTVQVHSAETGLRVSPVDFRDYPEVEDEEKGSNEPFPEDLPNITGAEILEEIRLSINPRAWRLFEERPESDWSKALWQLQLLLFDVNLPPVKVFIVARDAACNKYERDGRSMKLLWKEVLRAQAHYHKPKVEVQDLSYNKALLEESQIYYQLTELLSDEERDDCRRTKTIVEDYIDWASSLGDAAWQYHQAGAFIILSTLLSSNIQLPTSFGTVRPNLWFMILADTTLTRKTTAMDTAMDLLLEIDPDCVLATDGSIEGLMTSLAARPRRASVFLRDEFSGMLEQMSKRDYYAGMLETLTKLYDGKFQKRVLRKETLELKDPILILFAGGIKERILQLLTFDHVNSGFLPRFIFLTAESDISKLRPLGPPSFDNLDKKSKLSDRFSELHGSFIEQKTIKGAGKTLHLPKTSDASLTNDAWVRYNKFEAAMLQSGLDSNIPDALVPMFDRLAKSGLKAAVLIAASRSQGKAVHVEEEDVVRAIYYVEQWRAYAMEILANLGKSVAERRLERVFELIQRRPGISRAEIMRHHKLTAREADAVFSTLEQRGLIAKEAGKRATAYTTTGDN